MAKLMTYSQAISRFANLATTGIGIEEAIQEAVDRIYEMGRWPGTTIEIELTESDFIAGLDDHEWFVYFNEELYDGAIGFRNNYRGWAIVDHTCLYRDGINAGDREFVDYGTIVEESRLEVTGSLNDGANPVTFPLLYDGGIYSNTEKTAWVNKEAVSGPASPAYWAYASGASGVFGWILESPTATWTSAETPASPDLVVTWTPSGSATGTPVLDFFPWEKRKYRAPLGFSPTNGPYYCLMKLEAPTLKDDTIIPIHSTGALKCAILAVCQEYVNDDDRAMLNWQKFESFIVKAARQVDGPKRMTIGINSSLRRKPTQFL
jgi:hypothetical protein